MDLVDQRQLAGVLLLPLALPAVQLAGDVVLFFAQLAEADPVGIDLVDRDQGVDHPLADRPPVGGVGNASASAPSAGSGPRPSP